MPLTGQAKLDYMKKYREANAEAVRASKARCYEAKKAEYNAKAQANYVANREHYTVANRAWAKAHPERTKAIKRKHFENNRAAFYARRRAWYWTNHEKALRIIRESRQRHPMTVKAYLHARRARKLAAPGFATAEQLAARIAFYGHRCAYCGGPYDHLDHVIPLSRGGSNWPANIRPSCEHCNLSKGAKLITEWKAAA